MTPWQEVTRRFEKKDVKVVVLWPGLDLNERLLHYEVLRNAVQSRTPRHRVLRGYPFINRSLTKWLDFVWMGCGFYPIRGYLLSPRLVHPPRIWFSFALSTFTATQLTGVKLHLTAFPRSLTIPDSQSRFSPRRRMIQFAQSCPTAA
jgi:hypothetical protein